MGTVADVEGVTVPGLGRCGRLGGSGAPYWLAVGWSGLACPSIRIMDIRDFPLEPKEAERQEENQRQSSTHTRPAGHQHG
jgi:hypothetical protein